MVDRDSGSVRELPTQMLWSKTSVTNHQQITPQTELVRDQLYKDK